MTSVFKSTPSKPSSKLPLFDLDDRRCQIQQWMTQCRQRTLALLVGIDQTAFCQQVHPDFSPIGWHLGHIGFTESLWLLENLGGMPAPFPQYRRLYAADGLPKTERVHLPTLTETLDYLQMIRTQVFDYLAVAPLEQQERLWRWLLQHESQHCETITLVLELLRRQPPEFQGSPGMPAIHAHPAPTQMVQIPAGVCEWGHNSLDALDNEQPVQSGYLETYWIDRTPVTQAQYSEFIQAGGYENSTWWSEAGWQWLQQHPVDRPLYWSGNSLEADHPVWGVSWYEAEAYARFVGKRLPSEAEWEKAATWEPLSQRRQTYPWGDTFPTPQHCNYGHHVGSTTPVAQFPSGASAYGCHDCLGNVWEWTASWFEGYSGFTAYPYRGYSQAYFDRQHRVLRGGSWATFPWALRGAFRNWYHPEVRQVLAGFRCARDG